MFRIIWLQEAIDGLAAAYNTSARVGRSRGVTVAAEEVERLLAHDPRSAGESRGDDLRMLGVTPLVIDFEVFPDQMTAVVKRVRYVPPKRLR